MGRNIVMYATDSSSYLMHYGRKGMKWGQNLFTKDGKMKMKKGLSKPAQEAVREYNRLSGEEFMNKHYVSKREFANRYKKHYDTNYVGHRKAAGLKNATSRKSTAISLGSGAAAGAAGAALGYGIAKRVGGDRTTGVAIGSTLGGFAGSSAATIAANMKGRKNYDRENPRQAQREKDWAKARRDYRKSH